jgi:geranylgeranyl reductase family protein
METCDVLIVGGGPAGSTCAWRLRDAGLDVVVMDKAAFPRDKPCAGWITPQVLDDLQFDVDDYRGGRTFQPIGGFDVALVGRDHGVEIRYDRPVSFGIRRREFDDYLIRRSGARLLLGTGVTSIRRDGSRWIVNEAVQAPLLVGAGGHFCPVARLLNGPSHRIPLVVAQEVELPLDPPQESSFTAAAGVVEIYFCRDFLGYGWCFRKESYLNIGFGRLDPHALPKGSGEFVGFLKARHKVPADASWRWSGHAYLPSGARRQVVGPGVVLVGDAAGLAYPQSGEGIRPAIESGLMAASAALAAKGRYTRERLEPYGVSLQKRFGVGSLAGLLSRAAWGGTPAALASRLLETPWFVRRVVLDRLFLHARQPALAGTV